MFPASRSRKGDSRFRGRETSRSLTENLTPSRRRGRTGGDEGKYGYGGGKCLGRGERSGGDLPGVASGGGVPHGNWGGGVLLHANRGEHCVWSKKMEPSEKREIKKGQGHGEDGLPGRKESIPVKGRVHFPRFCVKQGFRDQLRLG